MGGSSIRNKTCMILIGIVLYAFLLAPNPNKVFAAIDNLDEKTKLIKAEIQNNMKIHNIPGMAFALVDAKGIVYSQGFGVLDAREDTRQIDENTNFNLGSLSKVFTSLAIMQLQEEGLVNIEKPVVDYLPWFSTKDTLLSSQIKIKHLLNHSSGLPGRLNVHDINQLDKQAIINEITNKLSDVTLVGQPGETFEYTNMNTDLLQLVIEEVAGEKITQYMDKKIFAPLGMDRTGYFTFEDNPLPNTAMGHRYHWGDIKPYKEELVYATSSSAGLSSNVRDLAKFITLLLNEGKGPAGTLISSNSINEMFQPNNNGVGFNWFVFPHNIYMEGGLPGFTTTMVLASDKSFGLVLLSNSKQDITYHSGFNLFRIVEGGAPKPLLASDFPKVKSDAKLILSIIMIIGILLAYVVVSTGFYLSKGRQKISFVKPSWIKFSTVIFILALYLGAMYYIYVLLPFRIGVPSLTDYKKEPDLLTGLFIFTLVYSAFSLVLCLKLLFVQKADSSMVELER